MPITDVASAMRELKKGDSTHIRSRAQAIAVGLNAERRAGKRIPKRTRAPRTASRAY